MHAGVISCTASLPTVLQKQQHPSLRVLMSADLRSTCFGDRVLEATLRPMGGAGGSSRAGDRQGGITNTVNMTDTSQHSRHRQSTKHSTGYLDRAPRQCIRSASTDICDLNL